MSLVDVDAFRVSADLVAKTEEQLRKAGRDGYELFVLWSGIIEDRVFLTRAAHVPRQQSYKTRDGLIVRVEGEALHKLNVWLYDKGQLLGAQIHAHPSDAFHSPTDDTYPIVTALGGLSIVAADFCRNGLLTPETAVYRLDKPGWVAAAAELVEVC